MMKQLVKDMHGHAGMVEKLEKQSLTYGTEQTNINGMSSYI